ncbi:NIPSNAP family protein [Neoasaia chiangmaiensis NBRC 101099]|uniref:Uncharacterized protein n=1 Tax=Neoasaia chiangmaiensis TaxID=320497 RepID=A0A1U9KT92_9PROT|nr:NIPSNAP family protein [Neoasaia chiangmaiensis]AQS88959.1 hypothetical protein A0U93_14695 [Neoasaia chiangmaiensis]GBR40286.1 NIPSNAP family protein [Neoasaia chiangmaiensis NBRC 101099]GEN13975.1 NIPSNAP family protein [Neoasaia chiangmaiensis]
MLYAETLIVQCAPGKMGGVLAALRPHVERAGLGCWTNEFGTLNRITLFRTSETLSFFDETPILGATDLPAGTGGTDRTRWRVVGDGVLPPGQHGPIYEWRCYDVATSRMADMTAGFLSALPRRLALSSLFAVMESLDGAARFCHIWPYESLAQRTDIRRQATEAGIWPPAGAADNLTAMCSEIILSADFSAYR